MKIIPHTLISWLECTSIIVASYLLLLHGARRYGNHIIFGTLAYVSCIALIYVTSCQLLIPLIPYATLLLALRFLLPHSSTQKMVKKSTQSHLSMQIDAQQPWLASCLKTAINHPHKSETITLMIASHEGLADAVHAPVSLNIPWNQLLFTSLLYDPQIGEGILWFLPNGTLVSTHVQWVTDLEIKGTALHAEQTSRHAALVCIIDQARRTCTLIDNGIVQQPKNISETVQYILMLTHHTDSLKEGMYHGARQEKQDAQHPNP